MSRALAWLIAVAACILTVAMYSEAQRRMAMCYETGYVSMGGD